ncbi:unnamed protein product [Anisakis simplex]|uniref:Phosphoinositide phospholipase C n=1 Tax=Anisakis simplex TaxID=6269 RepID=A0A0M3JUX3_ANISI|nr:unnamed protein product [Anisakis simplex]
MLQLSATEYQLFYSIQPMDYVRYVSCDLTSVPVIDNPSPVRNLVKRLSEVSSWITHVIVSMPTHEDRKTALTCIIRMIDACCNIGNFNAAVEILMGLKSEKLRPFWLSLRHDEKQKYEQLCEMLLPSNQAAPSTPYLEAVQRALRMPQCRLIPFFGVFLRDLYAIVNDMPNVVVIGHEDDKDKLEFMGDANGEDHFSSRIGVGGLLNADKISLVAVVLDNLELFHRHNRTVLKYVEEQNMSISTMTTTATPTAIIAGTATAGASTSAQSSGSAVATATIADIKVVKGYEPVQSIKGAAHGVTLVPLNTSAFDLDIIQRLHHGTTVIHYDPDSGRSVLCMLKLDASCGLISWHKVTYIGGSREGKEKDTSVANKSSVVNLSAMQTSDSVRVAPSSSSPSSPRPVGSASTGLDEGFLRLSYVKSVETVDSYDLDIEAIYRRHSNEEMSVPVFCWTISFGCVLSDNEFIYFLAPQQIAHYWIIGLKNVVRHLQEQQKNADRRVLWLKKLYLQLYSECSTISEQQSAAATTTSATSSNLSTPKAAALTRVAGSTVAAINNRHVDGPRPFDALQAFGGRVERWRGLGLNQNVATSSRSQADLATSNESGGARNRLKQMTIAMTRRMRGASRDGCRSQSPQPSSPPISSPKYRAPSVKSHMSSRSGPPSASNSPSYFLRPFGRNRDSGDTDRADLLDSSTSPVLDGGTRPRTSTSSSYGGHSLAGRSIKSWRSVKQPFKLQKKDESHEYYRSRGNGTSKSDSMSSGITQAQATGSATSVTTVNGTSGREFQEKPVSLIEFIELYRLFSLRMRKDLKDVFNECLAMGGGGRSLDSNNGTFGGCVHHANALIKRDSKQQQQHSSACSTTHSQQQQNFFWVRSNESSFTADILTRNNSTSPIYHINEKQWKIYNALAIASVNSTGVMDTSRSSFLTPAMLKQFIATHQMESVDEPYAIRLIQDHEPDPILRSKHQMSFEGFTRYLNDPVNFAFVPEQIKPDIETLHYPLSYYYICSSHNTYLTGHQLKGESSAEMYRQVLLTGCRCVELDCWDGDDGSPQIFHGHTFTSKISFRQVVEVIKKSAFITSNLPVILSIENHCSLQQQTRMAQMFKNHFGEKLVTNFLFEADFSDNPRLPSPWQLRNKILIKNKKMISEPSAGLHQETVNVTISNSVANRGTAVVSATGQPNSSAVGLMRGGAAIQSDLHRDQSKISYESSTVDEVDDDDLDEFLDEEEPEDEDPDERTDTESPRVIKRAGKLQDSNKQDSLNSENSDERKTSKTRQLTTSTGAMFDSKMDDDNIAYSPHSGVSGRPLSMRKAAAGPTLAPELSDLVIYVQAVKFKGFPAPNESHGGLRGRSHQVSAGAEDSFSGRMATTPSSINLPTTFASGSGASTKFRATTTNTANLIVTTTTPRRQRSSAQLHQQDAIPNSPSAAPSTLMSKSSEDFPMQSTCSSINSPLRDNTNASCYQVTSLNETAARKLCRKHALKCIIYSRDHVVRTYPGAMRIDSSNFNPIQYWAFGLQMIALNFQTADIAMAINAAMFEQTGNCGYTLKPRVLWDDTHPLYRRFNPLSKELSSCSALILTLSIISGQHVCANQHTASPFVEIEMFGVGSDCAKEKTKVVNRNSVNPIWNHTCSFRINFVELAFLRVAVCDNANGRCVAQRVVPVRCLRPGYRHLPLRTNSNLSIDQSMLFIHSRFEHEEHIYLHDEDSMSQCNVEQTLTYQTFKIDPAAQIKCVPMLKRQIFVLRIMGLYTDDTPTIVHAESASTVRNVMQLALSNAGKNADTVDEYALFEENIGASMRSTSISEAASTSASTFYGGAESSSTSDLLNHRVLPLNEPIMDAVACWNGSIRRFVMRKKGTDPSSRAWITSIIKSGVAGSSSGLVAQQQSAASTTISQNQLNANLSPTTTQDVTKRFNDGVVTAQTLKSSSTSTLHGRSLDVDHFKGTLNVNIGSYYYKLHFNSMNSSFCLFFYIPFMCILKVYKVCDICVQLYLSFLAESIMRKSKLVECLAMRSRTHSSAGDTFLMCVHNVSDDQPYAILRTSKHSTASDVIKQVFMKARRLDIDESEYVLMEELVTDAGSKESAPSASLHHGVLHALKDVSLSRKKNSDLSTSKGRVSVRVLASDENVWKTQCQWKNAGRFVLENRRDTVHSTLEKVRNFLQALESARANAGLQLASSP